MSDAALTDRIDGIRQLGSVVRAMTGIAGARARTARAQIAAVDGYAAMLVRALRQSTTREPAPPDPGARPALILFCAEQGFVGAFSERVLDHAGPDLTGVDLFLVGSRGARIAATRGIVPVWSAAMPSRSASLPKFADRLLGAVFADGALRRISVIYTAWDHGQATVSRHDLFPVVDAVQDTTPDAPLHNLPMGDLAADIGLDRLHASLTRAALHAFVAENEARMAAMAAASRQIDEELSVLQAIARRVRQEAITAEIIEIAAGAMAAR